MRRADSTSLKIFRHYIVEVFMRRTASTSLRSLSVPLPFLAIHTNTKPRSRWRLPWSLDSTMFCRSLRTLNAQRCSVGPQIPNMTGHDTHKPASSTRVGIALVLTVLATGAVAAQELPRSGQAALLPPRPDLPGRGRDPRWLAPELPHPRHARDPHEPGGGLQERSGASDGACQDDRDPGRPDLYRNVRQRGRGFSRRASSPPEC